MMRIIALFNIFYSRSSDGYFRFAGYYSVEFNEL